MQTSPEVSRRFISQARQLALLVVLALVLFTSFACSGTTPLAIAPPTATPVAKVLGEFTPIVGTDYLMAPIRQATVSTYTYSEFERSGYWGPMNNYVFLNRKTETFQQLLPTHDYVIARAHALKSPDAGLEAGMILGWLYSVIKSDTDGDNELSLMDKITLSVSDAGGAHYTEVLVDIDEVYGHTFRDNSTLLIIYRSADHKYLTSVDLSGYAIVSTTELTYLDPEVK